MLNATDLWLRGARWQPGRISEGRQVWHSGSGEGMCAVKVQAVMDVDSGTALRLLLEEPDGTSGVGGLGGRLRLVEHLSEFSDVVCWQPG